MKKILVVEDELVIAMGVSLLLEDAGYEVLMAANGRKGFEMAMGEAPDLIITDYMMPRMDGLAMIRALREAGVATPIILFTSIAENRLEGNPKRGYDAYVRKPALDEELMAALRSLLED